MTPPVEERERVGVLCVQSWAGRTEHPVAIVGETARRYRVRHLDSALRWLTGDVRLVPKYAVRAHPTPEDRRG